MNKNSALRISGVVAILTSIYHAVEGDSILRGLEIAPAEQFDFVWSTYQIGAMGWLAGGVLLLGAAGMQSQQARNWIVGVFAVLYGFPAFGAIALNGGNPGIGGTALAIVVILALVGRKVSPEAMAL